MSLREVRRAVESMQFTGRLARFQQPAADVRDVSLSAALEKHYLDLQRTLEAAQLQVLFSRPENEPTDQYLPGSVAADAFLCAAGGAGMLQPGDLVRTSKFSSRRDM